METGEERRDGIRRIVVGVDGSEGGRRAVSWAARLARATGAEVVAAHAIAPPIFAAGFSFVGGTTVDDDWQVAWKEWREFMHGTLEKEWCRPLAESGISFRAETVDGGPDALIQLAEKVDADMLVVGRRGRGGFAELVLGSFSHQLVHHAHRPVVVVPGEG